MGVYDDILQNSQPGWGVPVAVVTNQPGREVSYASGSLLHTAGFKSGWFFMPDSLQTGQGALQYLFSDRDLQEPNPEGGPFPIENPFAVTKADKLGLSISKPWLGGALTATFTLLSWGNAHFTVPLTDAAGVLIGQGAGVGANAQPATYVISFGQPMAPPK